jgi:hypothetical protein
LHDVLFEGGYWSLADDLLIIKRPRTTGRPIRLLLGDMDKFRPPITFPPALEFVRQHRRRFGFG